VFLPTHGSQHRDGCSQWRSCASSKGQARHQSRTDSRIGIHGRTSYLVGSEESRRSGYQQSVQYHTLAKCCLGCVCHATCIDLCTATRKTAHHWHCSIANKTVTFGNIGRFGVGNPCRNPIGYALFGKLRVIVCVQETKLFLMRSYSK
jgi:hypothetical protein